MPVFNKLPFRRRKPDSHIKDDDQVWYIETTNEVFTNYDDFFDRYIQMNSMCWTCAVTGKSGLTFEEAKESEEQAVKAVEDSFPKALAVPLLWLAHNYCYRGRLDDLVNDVYVVSRDHFFIGETVWYQKSEHSRSKGKVVAVEFDAAKALSMKNEKKESSKEPTPESENEDAQTHETSGASKKKSVIKPEDPEVPPPECYTYSFRAFEEDEDDEDAVVTEIPHSALMRPKAVGSRVKMRLFMKKLTDLRGDRVIVTKKTIEQYTLANRRWNEFFAGPLPDFPKSERRKPFGYINELKRKGSSPQPSSSNNNNNSPHPPEAKKKRTSSSAAATTKTPTTPMPKVKKDVQKQQDLLKDVFDQARSLHIENLSKWEQTQRLLTQYEIEELKEAVKVGKEEKLEREKEERKRHKEELAAQKRPRDDLFCDDLKLLPELKPLELPSDLSPEMFSEVLSISQFFHTFPKYFGENISLKDCVLALFSSKNETTNSKNLALVKVLSALLKARAFCIEKEDGDEANPKSPDEMSNETYNVFNNKIHGSKVAELNKLHEKYRILHCGISPPNLSTNWMTISEVLRLNLITSGYCPMGSVYPLRATNRGNIHCYEDPVYQHLLNDASLAEKLDTMSIFDLTLDERLTLINLLREQLLTFATFREIQEDRIVKLPDLRRQIKQLKLWDIEQEKASRISAYSTEESLTPKNPKNKIVIKLRNYLKGIKENRRGLNVEDVKPIFLENLPFDEFTPDEIQELREIQKNFVAEKLDELAAEIFETFCKLGNGFLGRDRAFRSYHYFEQYPIILVENVENPGECGDQTPMKDSDNDDDDVQDIINVFGCTGSMENCPVHCENKQKWFYLGNVGDLQNLIDACNPRGFREIDLSESLTTFKSWLEPAVDYLAALLKEGLEAVAAAATIIKDDPMNGIHEEEENIKKEESPENLQNGHSPEDIIPMENGLDKCEPDDKEEIKTRPKLRSQSKSKTPDSIISSNNNSSSKKKKSNNNNKEIISTAAEFMGLTEEIVKVKIEDFQDDENQKENPLSAELRNLLADFVSKIDLQALGDLEFNNENQTKESFLSALKNGGNIEPFITENDLKIHFYDDENILTQEEFDALENTEVNQIMLAFIKIIHGIRLKFFKDPFAVVEKVKNKLNTLPAKAFVIWQQGIPECHSLSALALFAHEFETNVQWISFKNTQKCAVCRRKTLAEESVACDNCGVQYHIQCAPKEVESRVAWLCKACSRKSIPARKKQKVEEVEEISETEDEEDEEMDFSDNPQPETPKGRNGKEASDDGEENEEEEGEEADESLKSNINMDDVFQTSDSPVPEDNNSSIENHGGENGDGRKLRREIKKRHIADYSELGNGSSNDSPINDNRGGRPQRRAAATAAAVREKNNHQIEDETNNFRAISMGLRGGTSTAETDVKKQLSKCQKIIEDALKLKEAFYFSAPVNAKEAPDYYEIIHKPMDLRTMMNKFKNLGYETPEEVWKDCCLIFQNCRVYNDDESDIVMDCNDLEQILTNQFRPIIGDAVN